MLYNIKFLSQIIIYMHLSLFNTINMAGGVHDKSGKEHSKDGNGDEIHFNGGFVPLYICESKKFVEKKDDGKKRERQVDKAIISVFSILDSRKRSPFIKINRGGGLETEQSGGVTATSDKNTISSSKMSAINNKLKVLI
jgi:hypothetical protein